MLWLLLLLQLDAAKLAFDRGDYATALKLFKASKPGCETTFFIGLTQYRLKQVNEALASFRAAAECDPKLIAAHLALGDAYLQRGSDREALGAYSRVLGIDPKNAAALRGAADVYLRADMKERAQPLLEKLVAQAPDPQARVDLAAVYAAAGERGKAEEQFLAALKLKPGFGAALMGLGNLYLRAGDDARALPLLEKAAAALPRAWEPHLLLGSAYNRASRFADALAELQTALKTGGTGEPEVYYHLARTYGGLGKADQRRQALSRFSELTRRAKENAEGERRVRVLVDEARSLLESGDLKAAAAKLEQARELRPGDPTLLFRLAGLQFDLGQFDAARQNAQAAISLDSSAWVYHFLLGLVEKSSGHLAEARESLEAALKLNPSAADARKALEEIRQ